MSRYDFKRQKEIAQERLDRLAEARFQAERPMGNVAISKLAEVIELWLVGKHAEATVYLPRIIDWLDGAIARQEPFGANQPFHLQHLYEGRALAGWMLTGEDDPQLWEQARVFCEAAWREPSRPWTRAEVLRDPLDDYMVYAAMAGAPDEIWQDALAMYQSWLVAPEISMKKTLKLRDYSYALIQSNLGDPVQPDAVLLAVGEKILAAHLTEVWLGRGQSSRAMAALKLIYVDRDRWSAGADHAPPGPLEVALKTLKFLPAA